MIRRRSVTTIVGLCGLVGLAGVVAGQPSASQPFSELGLGLRMVIRFAVGAVVNLVIGALGMAVAPEYVRRSVANIKEDVGAAVGWGLLMGLAVPIVLGVLAATGIGLLIAIPGLIVLFVLGLAGTAVTVNWVGTWLGAGSEATMRGTVLGALLLGALYSIPFLGNLMLWALGLVGLGIVSKQAYEGRSGGGSTSSTHSDF